MYQCCNLLSTDEAVMQTEA